MDTGASGNLLPIFTYHKLFPNHTMKDLGMTIDPNVELLTATKSSIKQLGIVCLWVYHCQFNSPYECLYFVVPNKCKPILGLPDLMQLNLVSFNFWVCKSWDGDDTSFVFNSCEEKSGTILNKYTLVNGQMFKSIFSGIGRFPVDPVNIQLTDDAVPVQKPSCRVPVPLKEKFENEFRSMEKQGIISKLDHITATE